MTSQPAPGLPVAEEPNPLIALFRRCVVRITDDREKFRGSGFFVAPGQLLTCGHVAHGAHTLRVQWQEQVAVADEVAAAPPLASVPDPESYPLPDLAVLTVSDASEWGHPCAALTTEQPALGGPGDSLYLAGYTVEHSSVPAFTGTTTEFESLITEDGHTFLKLKRGLILPGFSGSPVLDLRAELVAGIVESSRGRHADLGGFAVPVTELAAAFPEVLAANQAFHRDDHAWRDAAEAERVGAREREKGRGQLLRSAVVRLTPDEDVSAAKVLRPRHAIVDYVGRDQLLGALADWCEREPDDEPSLGFWFVTGGGGFGKTRLAVEACQEAEARGWTAGLLSPSASQARLQALAEWPGRLLIAVDYAETNPALIAQLADELAARGPRPPVRVMLLVRRRASRADLLELFNEQREDQLDALLRRASMSRLEEADSEVDRLELFQHAVDDFSAFYDVPPPELEPPRLRADHFTRPLYVLTAAYLTRSSAEVDVDLLSEADLLRTLLTEHEADHWDRWNTRRQLGLDRADQRVAVAVATLLTAQGEDEALTAARLIPHFGGESEARMLAIARWLSQLYPPSGGSGPLAIAPLEPDRLGEVLVGDVLKEYPGLLAPALDAATDRQLTQALTVAGRIARDDQAVDEQLRAALDERLGDLFYRGFAAEGSELLNAIISAMTISRPVRGAVDTAERFPDVLPVWLRPLAVSITALAVDGLRTQVDADPAAISDLATALNNLANRLSDVGRRLEALEVAQEAVVIRRQLAGDSPATFLPDLAMSLNNLASFLSDVGRRSEALEVAQEAVVIRRKLAEDNPATFLPNLATALNNLANRLSDVGRRSEALEVAQEAVVIRRQLAGDSPATFLPDLAMSLNNLASFLSGVGRRLEALEVAQEAVVIRRQLAGDSPATYLHDLAKSLNNLASFLSDVGRRSEALEVAQEAVTYYRQLAEDNPATFLPDLAMSLNNLANRLSEVGRWSEALEVAQEAVTYYRQLAGDSPATYLHDLATALNNLAGRLSDVGRRSEALEVAQEAVTYYRQLAEDNPATFLPDLAVVLNNLASFLSGVGRRLEALEVVQEAVVIRRQLAGDSPATFLPDLAMSLDNLAGRLSEVGQPDEAQEIFSNIFGCFPDSTIGIGHILMAQGRWRAGQGRIPDAIADVNAAVSAFERDGDRVARGQARQLLRALREDYGSTFDLAWEQVGKSVPLWLRHLVTDRQMVEMIHAWISAADWLASQAYLNANAGILLTEIAQAALEHLIDDDPTSSVLEDHFRLLQTARVNGVDAAYADHQRQLLIEHLIRTLEHWLATRTWTASRVFATAHAGELLHSITRDALDDSGSRDLADATFRLHRGLLTYAAVAGFAAAYDLLADAARRQHMITDPATPAPTRLALARLHSGQSTDDPQAHFQLAVITLQAGKPDEAAAVLADCADNAAPFERRDFAHRLRQATADQPQLALITAELQQILLPPPNGNQVDGDPDNTPVAPVENSLIDLVSAWIETPTWEESEAFLTCHAQELLTLSGYTTLNQLAATKPDNDKLGLRLNLLSAVLAQGIGSAYAQLRAELAQAERANLLGEWIGLSADLAASAAYLAEHAPELHDPQTISHLSAECDRRPADSRLWQHLGLLLLVDQSADGYTAMQTGDLSAFQHSAALVDTDDLDQALAWACLARAADPAPGALLMGRIQTLRGELDRARQALATATEQIDAEHLGEVLDAYDQLITVQPDQAWLHAEHAAALRRAGQPDDALAAYDQALTFAPGDPSLHFNKGNLLFSLSRMSEAQAEFRTVTELRPGDILGAAVLLAGIHWPTDTDQARSYFQAALASPGERLTPFSRAFFRAIALAGLDRTDDALGELKAAAASGNGQASTLDDVDRALLERFGDPPIPGYQQLLQFFAPE